MAKNYTNNRTGAEFSLDNNRHHRKPHPYPPQQKQTEPGMPSMPGPLTPRDLIIFYDIEYPRFNAFFGGTPEHTFNEFYDGKLNIDGEIFYVSISLIPENRVNISNLQNGRGIGPIVFEVKAAARP